MTWNYRFYDNATDQMFYFQVVNPNPKLLISKWTQTKQNIKIKNVLYESIAKFKLKASKHRYELRDDVLHWNQGSPSTHGRFLRKYTFHDDEYVFLKPEKIPQPMIRKVNDLNWKRSQR